MNTKIYLFVIYFFSFQLTAVYAQQDTKKNDILNPENIAGETYGQKLESLLFWTQEEREQRFPQMQNIFPNAKVEKGNPLEVYKLEENKQIQPLWEDETTVESYITDNHIAGLIVLQNNQIKLEAYGENVNKNSLWTSFSVAKSISSMLLGIALKEGDIKSLEDELQAYIPELKGHDYGKVTVRQLLTMTSGIAWNEDYEDPKADVAQMYQAPCVGSEAHILTYMKKLKFKENGQKEWNYSTGETDLLGILIQKATRKSLSAYLSEKIWKPWGMENDAFWLADECSDLNLGGSGLSASLRDFARLGTVMLNSGKKEGLELFSTEWLENATQPLFKTNENSDSGYGYLWWRNQDGSYLAAGIFGQMIYINPEKNLVIAQNATWPQASSMELVKKRQKFIEAVQKVL